MASNEDLIASSRRTQSAPATPPGTVTPALVSPRGNRPLYREGGTLQINGGSNRTTRKASSGWEEAAGGHRPIVLLQFIMISWQQEICQYDEPGAYGRRALWSEDS